MYSLQWGHLNPDIFSIIPSTYLFIVFAIAIYRDEIEDCAEVYQFESFKKILYDQIEDYFIRIKNEDTKAEIEDYGFFTETLTKLRDGSH